VRLSGAEQRRSESPRSRARSTAGRSIPHADIGRWSFGCSTRSSTDRATATSTPTAGIRRTAVWSSSA